MLDLAAGVAQIIARAEALRRQASSQPDIGPFAVLETIQTVAQQFADVVDRLARESETSDPRSFSRTVRHDLLNSVNQMMGYTEMLLEDALAEGLEWPVDDLEQIITGARQLSSALSPDSAVIDDPLSNQAGTRIQPRTGSSAAHPLLVVDDDALNRDLLTNRLRRQGFEVRAAGDGLRALEILEGEPIDLVLLDVLMPELDGYQVLERMKANPVLQDIPVLMISGLHEIDSVVRCIEMGAADYLPKPPNPVLLRARIGACLERKQLRDLERRTFSALKASQEALATELAEAADYVRSLLPPPIRTDEVTIDWRFIPSSQLGGDAFGYQWLDADHLAVYLFDVCGHGVGAALLSVSIINVLRSGRLGDADMRRPDQVLDALNAAFQMDQHNGQYFTIWYGVYDRRSRQLEHSSGGHPAAVLLGSEGDSPNVELLRRPGLMIGAVPDAVYGTGRTHVAPGSRLYVFSDGLFERKTAEGTMLGDETFLRMLTSAAGPDLGLDGLIEQLRSVGAADAFDDDASILVISFA